MIGTEILKAELQIEKSWGGGSFCIFVMYKENREDIIFQNSIFTEEKCHTPEKCQWKIGLMMMKEFCDN